MKQLRHLITSITIKCIIFQNEGGITIPKKFSGLVFGLIVNLKGAKYMLKRTVEYKDFDGNDRKEDLYFHLTKAEVIEWLTTSGDYTLDKLLVKLSTERNGKEIIRIFKDLVCRSYGEKSLDGRQFNKTDEIRQKFVSSEAYSIIFTELVTDANKAVEFINGIIPADMAAEINNIIETNPDGIPDEVKDYLISAK
jgi:hypothetical protein